MKTLETVVSDGEFSLKQLLEQIESLWEFMDADPRPKKRSLHSLSHVPDSHLSIFNMMGPALIALDSQFRLNDDPMNLRVDTPIPDVAFSAFYSDNAKEGFNRWLMLYSRRIDKLPWNVVPSGPGWAYDVIVEWVWDGDKNNVATLVNIDPDSGRIHPCRFLEHRQSPIGRGFQSNTVTTRNWVYDPTFTTSLEDGKTPLLCFLPWALDAERMMDTHVVFQAHRYTETYRRWPMRVRAPITMDCARRIFSSRDKTAKTITQGGKRRPIFHWSKAHYRNIYDEPRNWLERMLWKLLPRLRRVKKTVPVRTHLKGLQGFEVGGMSCNLLMPQRDTALQTENKLLTGVDWGAKGSEPCAGDAAIESMFVEEPFKPKWYEPFKSRNQAA